MKTRAGPRSIREAKAGAGFLLVTHSPVPGQPGRRYVLAANERTLTLGRGVEADIVLPDEEVSHIHARLTLLEGTRFIADNESTNGTFVAGRRVSSETLREGDLIQVGRTTLRYEGR